MIAKIFPYDGLLFIVTNQGFENMNEILSFLLEAVRLKRMPRQGWVFSGVPVSEVESVADHSFFVVLITLIICLEERSKGREVNLEKALIMALLHDLSEGVSQDIDRRLKKFTPESYDYFKHELDENASKELLAMLPASYGNQLFEYYKELSKQESKEARIVMEADRLETALQLIFYTKLGIPKNLFWEFFDNISKERGKYQTELVTNLLTKLLEEGAVVDK